MIPQANEFFNLLFCSFHGGHLNEFLFQFLPTASTIYFWKAPGSLQPSVSEEKIHFQRAVMARREGAKQSIDAQIRRA
jgi:hypothetical protein